MLINQEQIAEKSLSNTPNMFLPLYHPLSLVLGKGGKRHIYNFPQKEKKIIKGNIM